MVSNRERFETWYLKAYWQGSDAGRTYLVQEACGGYTYSKPQELWEAWEAGQPAAACKDGLRAWLATEMPAGTVIGDPAWWSERILKRVGAAAHGDAAVRKDAERYRLLRRGQKWSVINGIGDELRAEALDSAIDAAKRAQGDDKKEVR